jgi:HSP20 family protein
MFTLSRRLFDPFAWPDEAPTTFVPALDAWEDDAGLHLEAEVPGMRQADLEVSVHGGVVTLRGEKKLGERPLQRRERLAGRFERAFELPWEADAARVTASLRDGVLHVTVPKSPTAKPQRIEVRAE